MNRESIFKYLNLPEGFGELTISFAFILLIAPYFSGLDFGIVRIPQFRENTKKTFKFFGPVLFAFSILLFIPFLERTNVVSLENPFGESEILLDEKDLKIQTDKFGEKGENTFIDNKHLFQINVPEKGNGWDYELISIDEYSERFNMKVTGLFGGGMGDMAKSLVRHNPVFKDAQVFRIFRTTPNKLILTQKSYVGEKVSKETLDSLRKEIYGDIFNGFNNTMSRNLKTKSTGKILEDTVKNKILDAFSALMDGERTEELTLFNEIAIIIFKKESFEKSIMVGNNGRIVKTNPFVFLLSAGGTLPYIDMLSVKQISVSKNNDVWGFYGQRDFHKLIIDNRFENDVFYDFYRLYSMNSEFIYQITLSYIPNPNHPRNTWEKLVEHLSTFRIVE